MYRLNKYIALIFLFLLTGISLPKSWIHHCPSETRKALSHSNETQHSNEHTEEECAVCAFEMGTLATPDYARIAFAVEFLAELYSEETNIIYYSSPVTSQNKAPPVANHLLT